MSPYFGDILKRQILGMTDGLDGRGWRAYLWTPRVLLIVVPFVVLLLVETRERTWAAFGACLGLALGSTIPTVAGYAAPHTISESAIAVGMLVPTSESACAGSWPTAQAPHRRDAGTCALDSASARSAPRADRHAGAS